jgi:uncharacterized protein (TIGR00369 family)
VLDPLQGLTTRAPRRETFITQGTGATMSTIDLSPADIAARWNEQEAAVRADWGEPGVIDPATMRTMSGMEVFAAIRDGKLPTPHIGRVLDFIAIEFEPGRMVFQGTPRRDHYNPLGTVHGGYAATLLDSCVGCAVHTMLPAGKGYTTLELKINYIRAMTDRTGPVRAEGKTISVGNQAAVAEGRLTDSSGRLLAYATTTCLIFPI